MDESEVWVLIMSLVISIIFFRNWFFYGGRLQAIRPADSSVWLLKLSLPACLLALYVVLRYGASHDVRDSVFYLSFYLIFGLAWLGLGLNLFKFGGLSFEEDVIMLRNPQATVSLVGAMIGWTLCYAGGNIGDGPGWWVVAASAILSGMIFAFSWMLFQGMTNILEAVTLDREPGSGALLGGFLVFQGIVLGRSVAGNWVSLESLVMDALPGLLAALGMTLIAGSILMRFPAANAEDGFRPAVRYGLPLFCCAALAAGFLFLEGLPK